jgi:HD-like signal output (HDOD) protein
MLGSLFRSNARSRQGETAELAARLEQNVLALVDNMPALPNTAARAMSMANDRDTNFAEFTRLIEGDVAIATGLLRIANSALYCGGAPATKLHQAVVRLGAARCTNLILAISMKTLIWEMADDEKAQCEALWHHGHVTGCLCHQINQSFRLLGDGSEFAAGLLHDLGRILLLLADPECFALANAMDFGEEPGLLERERAAIGIDHCALGSWFGLHSKLPDALIQGMKFHHEPEAAEQPQPLVALIATADHMANHLQRGEEIDTYNPEENWGLAQLWVRWPERKRERFLDAIPDMMEASLRAAAAEQTVP